jgi:hypothetical protein
MADMWACSQCRSINTNKDRCYKCRTPRAIGGVAPTELRTVGPSEATRPTGRYRSSWFRAVLASVSISALTVLSVLSVGAILPQNTDVSVVIIGLAVASLTTFAAWLSRVVSNIPPLTGEYPRATPRMTFIQVLVPVRNFWWIPSILREVVRILDPRGNGDALITAAVLPLVVAAGGALIGARPLLIAERLGIITFSTMRTIDTIYIEALVGLLAVGAVMLLLVIVRIERRSMSQAREARLAVAGA